MATIRERSRGDGSTAWQAMIRVQGYPERTQTFDTRQAAEDWAKMIEGQIVEGRHFPGAVARRKTLADAIDRYLEFELPKKKGDGEMHRTTLTWWKAELGKVKLADLTRAIVVEYRDRLTRHKHRGRQLSNARVNRYIACLRHLFTVAVGEWEWATWNPAQGIRPLRESRGRVRALSDVERRALFGSTAKDSVLHTFVLIALSTACRAGELQKLVWADVDLKAGQVLFRDTKNGEARAAWVAGEALRLLKAHGKVRKLKGGLVFQNASGRGLYDYARPFRAAVAAAGIRDFRFHDLRHTAATYLARDGATEQQLRAIGGWKSSIVSRYVHLAANDAKLAIDRLAKQLGPDQQPDGAASE